MGTAIVLRAPEGPGPDGTAVPWQRRVLAALEEEFEAAGLAHLEATELDGLLELLSAVTGQDEPVLVVDACTVLSPGALRALAFDPRITSGVLVRAAAPDTGPSPRAVRVDRGVVVASSSPLHAPLVSRTSTVGAVVLDTAGREALAAALRQLRNEVDPAALERAFAQGPVEVVLAGLLAAGHRLSAVDARGMVAERVDGPDEAEAALQRLADADHDRAWLDAAVKARDGFFTTFFVSPYTRFIARWAARRGLTPNQITLASMLVGLAAAAGFAHGGRGAAVAGAVALQAAFALDCVDGQLARYTQRFTPFGAWLDSILDRAKEYVVYAGLAYGAARTGTEGIWALAAAALALQVVRHTIDLSFTWHRPAPRVAAPAPADGAPASVGSVGRSAGAPATTAPTVSDDGGGRVLEAAAAAEERALLKWGKRIVVFPIGERFAVISLTAALATPELTFTILLGWGAIGGLYTATGRVLRARRW